MWKYQIENAVRVMVLKVSCLEQSKILVPNPKFRITNAKIISDFLASIFNRSAFLPQVVGCSSAFEVWNTISQNFNSQSSAKVMFYKSQMQMLKKDGLTMRDYLTKMKNYCDLLATAGHKISDTDHILAIMQGLGDEYESVIAVISSKKSSPSLQYVTSTLIAHEGRIAHKISSNDLSVNYTSQYSNRGNQVTRGSFVHNRGRGRGRAQGGIKPQCQLCNKFGHTVHRCFYRYDPNFHGNMLGARNGASGSISSAGNVNLTESSKLLLVPRFRATNHVTHDLGNLNFGVEYNDKSNHSYSCRQSA
ncbi:hypothetical protein AAG906_019040 [Vitis piasezkii]